MEITPPFGYTSVTPLLREMRIRPNTGSLPAFARNRNSLPIVAGEAVIASHDYPIAFVASSPTDFALIVLLGVVPGENLFATPTGWAAGCYVPAYVRRYPYCMTRPVPTGGAQLAPIICVEHEALADDGVANFDSAGNPTAEFVQVRDLIGRFEEEVDRTRELCSLFESYKLLEPMTAQVRIGAETFDLNGLVRIAEPRLQNLTSNQLKTLIRKGGMALIYQHLSSMTRFENLTHRKTLALEREQELAARSAG